MEKRRCHVLGNLIEIGAFRVGRETREIELRVADALGAGCVRAGKRFPTGGELVETDVLDLLACLAFDEDARQMLRASLDSARAFEFVELVMQLTQPDTRCRICLHERQGVSRYVR